VSQIDRTREHLIETYRKKAEHYDITSRFYPVPGYPQRAQRLRAVQALGLRPGDSVIDIACGTGLTFPLIEEVSSTRPARHWVEALERAGVPCGLLQTYDQVFNDPHLLSRGFFPDAPHSRLGPVKQIASPMRLSETPTRMVRAGPLLGEHSAEVLAELGYSGEEIDKLARAGVIREPA